MTTVPNEQLAAALQWRYATKQFDASRQIPADTWALLQQSLVLAPSSFGLQPWKFISVETPSVRAQLQPLAWNQSQTTEASRFVVLAHRTEILDTDIDRFIRTSAAARGQKPEDLAGYRKVLSGFVAGFPSPADAANWAAKQVYIALGQLMTTAALAGVDSCPMEGIDKGGFDRVLGLPGTGYTTTVACALGYRAPTDKYATLPKVRYPLAEVFASR